MSDRQEQLEAALRSALDVAHLVVENESHRHNVPAGSESHFKVTVVSDAFIGQPLLTRHRAVYDALQDHLRAGLHALAIHAYTVAEWTERHGDIPASPPCRGGGREPVAR